MDKQSVDQGRSGDVSLRLVWETPQLQRIRAKAAEKHEHGPHPDEGANHMS